MGILRDLETGERLTLAARTVLGRSAMCRIRAAGRRVSSEHARLVWGGAAWLLRDLGSRNGTWMGGEQLDPGVDHPLAVGARFALGREGPAYCLTHAAPPVALARRLADDVVVVARDGVLVIEPDHPAAVCAFEGRDGGWWVDGIDDTRQVRDLDAITVDGIAWVLHLPQTLAETVEDTAAPPTLDMVGLVLRVSPDEEHVEVTVRVGDAVHALPPRAHHYTLLTLARARLVDRDTHQLGAELAGWRHGPTLGEQLGMDEQRLNVEVYRIRRDLGGLGVVGAGAVIERRRGTRELRLGVADLVVERLG